jgi:hypothetical protein
LNNNTHFGIYRVHFTKEPHKFFFRAIYSYGLEQQIVQYPEVDLRDRGISTRGELVDECLERLLGNHDLINCGAVVSVVKIATVWILPRPLFPCSVIKSRRRYIPLIGQDGSSG